MKTPVLVCLLLILQFAVAADLNSQDEVKEDPYEWVVEVYAFPAYDLVRGFATEERGSLKAPVFPGGEITDEVALDFVRKSNSVVSHYLKKQGVALPQGSVVIYDPATFTLSVRAPRIAQKSIAFASADLRRNFETYLEMNTVLLEGKGSLIREQLSRAGDTADHSDLLAKLEAAVPNGDAVILQRDRFDCRSGQRAKIDHSREVTFSTDHRLTADGMLLYDSESYREGTVWEVDPVISADRTIVDLNFALAHHFAPTQPRQIQFATTAKGAVTSNVVENSLARVVTQVTAPTPGTKLAGVWKARAVPGGADDPDRLQAGFVTANAIEVLPLPNPKLTGILGKHADAIAAIPAGKPVFEKIAEEIPEGMIVRRFRIPPTFLSTGTSAAAGADPFASAVPSEPRFTVRSTVKDILMAAGIPFPAGSSANYFSENSTLVIRNTPENIELVEAYVMSIRQGVERDIGFSLYVIEGPAQKIRDIVSKTHGLPDHIAAWEIAAGDQDISHIANYWLESRSGQRSKIEVYREFVYPISNDIVAQLPKEGEAKNEVDPVGTLSGAFETHNVGASFEVDPVLGGDQTTIDINYQFIFDYAEPSTTPEPARQEGNAQLVGPSTRWHRATLTSQTTIWDGMTRLLGYWKPEGAPRFDGKDLLQAVFVKVDAIPVLEEEDPLLEP